MAIRRITLRDFVIVHQLTLDLANGYTALTGETGAGKSILIDAVQIALGERADSSTIRDGAQRAEISLEFEDIPKTALNFLRDAGFESDDGALLIRRVIDNQGKSRAWINGSVATATQLKQLGEWLVNIYGQHAWHSLTRSESIRHTLDDYANISLAELTHAWEAWQKAKQTLDKAKHAQDSLQEEFERVSWQIKELDRLSPIDNEWEHLEQQHQRLSHIQTLLDAAVFCTNVLENDGSGIDRSISLAINKLQSCTTFEPEFAQHIQALEAAQTQLNEVGRDLRNYVNRIDQDPQQLEVINHRITLWVSLSKQFRRTPESLPEFLTQCLAKRDALAQSFDMHALENSVKHTFDAYLTCAKTITTARKKYAKQLAKQVTETMQTLGMQGGNFDVELTPLDKPSSYGAESVNFLFSGHQGGLLRPIGKTASGGELSRISLAISVCTSLQSQATTHIFDEVDSGIGGAVAHTVGKLMHQLGNSAQVLAVTHLPQVAACAHQQLQVIKKLVGDQTQSSVVPLSERERIDEIARMLSGNATSPTTIAHAKELLQLRP